MYISETLNGLIGVNSEQDRIEVDEYRYIDDASNGNGGVKKRIVDGTFIIKGKKK